VETFYSCDGRIHRAVEQPELLALLKLIRSQSKPGGPHRRKANGNWSAEEDFFPGLVAIVSSNVARNLRFKTT